MSTIENNTSFPDSEDPFEKDAKDGFNLLSKVELTALKAETDLAMKRVLNPVASGKRSIIYWSAAALLLAVGFSIFLVLQPEIPKKIALQQPEAPMEKTLSSPPLETLADSFSEKTPEVKVGPTAKRKKEKEPRKEKTSNTPQAPDESKEGIASDLARGPENENLDVAANAASPAQPDVAMKMEMAPQKKNLDRKEKLAASFSSAPANTLPQQFTAEQTKISFKGGDAALTNELRKIFATDSLTSSVQIFFILSKSGKIEKVEFNTHPALSSANYKLRKQKLKEIKGFEIREQTGMVFPITYSLTYQR